MKGLIALASSAVIGGCAMMQPAPTGDAWTSWTCDSKAQVHWRYADQSRSAVDVRLNDSEQVFQLKAEPGAPSLYSNGVLAFQNKGNEGLVYWEATNDLIGRGCK
jgi:membrane-bound inhibitor of C-type lysozyme